MPTPTLAGKVAGVDISTIAVIDPPVGLAAYAATKASAEALASSLACELGPRGIAGNAVRPGPTETEMYAGLSDDASFTTGQVLSVSGGATP